MQVINEIDIIEKNNHDYRGSCAPPVLIIKAFRYYGYSNLIVMEFPDGEKYVVDGTEMINAIKNVRIDEAKDG